MGTNSDAWELLPAASMYFFSLERNRAERLVEVCR